MVSDYVLSTIQYIQDNLQVEVIGAVVIIALILLLIFSIIFFAFRSVRLWYWRVNDQIKTLENIDNSLKEIKQNLPEVSKVEITATLEEQDLSNQTIPLSEECVAITQDEQQTQTPKIIFDKKDKDERTTIKSGYNIGKTGKIYAEEILREQIQF